MPIKFEIFLTNSIFKLSNESTNNKNNQINVFSNFINFFLIKNIGTKNKNIIAKYLIIFI